MADPMGAQTGTTKPLMRKGVDMATNPKWATAKIVVRGTIITLSLAASITSLVYMSAPKQYSDWILFAPTYGLPYVSPSTYMGPARMSLHRR